MSNGIIHVADADQMSRQVALAGYGLPDNRRDSTPPPYDIHLPFAAHDGPPAPVAVAMIATCNYISYVRVLARSFMQFHPDIPVHVLLVDGDAADGQQIEGVTVTLLDDLRLDFAGWYCAKFDATQFANALKPVYIQHLAGSFETIVYFDTDVALFAPIDALLGALAGHDIVAVPHMFAPFDKPERFWVHPTNADIFNSGLINAGCFGIRPARCTAFLDFWRRANLGPGAFYENAGMQTDQQYFNWAPLLVNRYTVLKDRAYNVAYWNLHERSLRWNALDDGGEGWTVDQQPLVFFHFSGFNPLDPLVLSRHDGRYLVYNMPAIAEILDWYSKSLFDADFIATSMRPYRFEALGNGLYLNKFLRGVLNKFETYIPKFDTRNAAGADRLCAFLMAPLPATGSLLPLIAAEIYEARQDLRSGFPDSHLKPLKDNLYWGWFLQYGPADFDIYALVCRFRRVLTTEPLVTFAADVARKLANFGQTQFLGMERNAAAEQLRMVAQPELAERLLRGQMELCFTTCMSAILTLYDDREDLRKGFPFIFGESRDKFAEWLTEHGVPEHNIPQSAIDDYRTRSWNMTLAHIFSFLSRREEMGSLAHQKMLSDAPWELVRALIRGAGDGIEYDLTDIEIFLFLHKYERHVLVPVFLELPYVRRLAISSRVKENRLGLLPAEARATKWAAHGCKLHESYCDGFSACLEDEIKKRVVPDASLNMTVADYLRADDKIRRASQIITSSYQAAQRRFASSGAPAAKPADNANEHRRTLNIFGFFHADTGVGESSRGLADATMRLAGVRRIPLCTGSVTDGVRLHQLFHRYDYLSKCNVIVSYPHQYEDFFGILPRDYTVGRANIIHLAWEQRDWNPYWKRIYDRYDEIWAISDFAAEPFRRLFGARVQVIPNVVRPLLAGAAAATQANQGRFRFTFVFDANSSIERKNPDAVIEAFIRAFRGRPEAADVELYLKVGNLDRLEHATRVHQLKALAAYSGLSITFDGRVLTREALLGVIAASGCYVSLHRSEGFGYTMAEAMWLGVPVVASGYSGNLEYMNADNSYLVPCTETLVKEADGPFQRGSVWGEPDIDAAADILRAVFTDRGQAKSVGDRGRAFVRQHLSAQAVSERIAGSAVIAAL